MQGVGRTGALLWALPAAALILATSLVGFTPSGGTALAADVTCPPSSSLARSSIQNIVSNDSPGSALLLVDGVPAEVGTRVAAVTSAHVMAGCINVTTPGVFRLLVNGNDDMDATASYPRVGEPFRFEVTQPTDAAPRSPSSLVVTDPTGIVPGPGFSLTLRPRGSYFFVDVLVGSSLTSTPTIPATPAASLTPTGTLTATPTPALSASGTPTSTSIASVTAISTATPPPSSTPTSTETASTTATPTVTTPTSSPTTTPSPLATATPSATRTATATRTPSPTRTPTDTATPTSTATSGPPPVVAITNAPPGVSSSSTASFSFVSSVLGSTFTCQLDQAPAAACSSPKSYSGLADGAHTFAAWAADGAPTTFTWLVDRTDPTVVVSAPVNSAALSTRSPTFVADVADAGSGITGVQFQLSSDGGTTYAALGGPLVSAPFSLVAPAPLAEGSYFVRALATDGAGNQRTSARAGFIVDATPPSANYTGPSGLVATRNPKLSAQALDGAGSGVASVQFLLSADGGATWRDQGTDTSGSSNAYTVTVAQGLADGSYRVRVIATDRAGNPATQDGSEFTVDATPPGAPTVSDPAGAVTVNSTTYTVSGSAEAGTLVQVWKSDGSSPRGTLPSGAQRLGQGETRFSIGVTLTRSAANFFLVTATDDAGNESTTAGVPIITHRTASSGGGGGGGGGGLPSSNAAAATQEPAGDTPVPASVPTPARTPRPRATVPPATPSPPPLNIPDTAIASATPSPIAFVAVEPGLEAFATTPDGVLSISIPADAAAQPLTLAIMPAAPTPDDALPADGTLRAGTLSFVLLLHDVASGAAVTGLDQPLTLTLSPSSADQAAAAAGELDLTLTYFDALLGDWVSIPTTLNEDGTLTAVFALPLPTSAQDPPPGAEPAADSVEAAETMDAAPEDPPVEAVE